MTSPVNLRIVMKIIIVTLLLIASSREGAAGGYQRIVVAPKSVEVVEGGEVELPCVVENQQGKVQWTKDGFVLGYERHVPGYPRYSYTGDPTLGQHHLIISDITLTEDGEYQCQVSPTNTNPKAWAAANVTVLIAPKNVNLVGWRNDEVVEVEAGTELRLECVVSMSRPPPTIAWYIDGRQVSPGLVEEQTESSGDPRRWRARAWLTVAPLASDDGQRVTCEARHPALPPPPDDTLSSSVTLSVLHLPGAPTITGLSLGERLQAGEHRTLACRVSGGKPLPRVTWYRSGHLLDDTTTRDVSGGQVNMYNLEVTPRDDGAVYECRVNSALLEHPLTANITLNVYYAPSFVSVSGPSQVEENSVINLKCRSSESNPPASLTWAVQGEVVTTTSHEVMGQVSGSNGWVTSSHLSHYVKKSPEVTQVTVECRAKNPTIHTRVTDTKIITINKPPGPPVFEGGLRGKVVAGTILELTCTSVGGHPNPTIRIYKEETEVATQVTHEANGTKATGQIEVSPVDNGSKITCEVTTPTSASPLTTSSRLAVQFAPQEVTGSALPPTVEAGGIVTLTCDSSSSLPPSNITWRSQEEVMTGARIRSNQAAFGGTSTRSELQLRTRAEDNGRVVVCEADNGLARPVNTKIILNVLHPPIWQERPPSRLEVQEGGTLVVNASALANPGPVRYRWRGENQVMGASGRQLVLPQITRRQANNYTVTAHTSRGSVNSTFYVDVLYGPEQVQVEDRVTAGEGGTINTLCTARGNPVPHLTWTTQSHSTSRLAPTRQLATAKPTTLGSGVGMARLHLTSVTSSDTGAYFCHAVNVVGSAQPMRTNIVVLQGVSVPKEQHRGRAAWASMGGTGRMVCKVKAAPQPDFMWSRENLILINSDKYIIHEPKLEDGLILWSSVLEVRDVGHLDYTNYTCSSTNNLGEDHLVISLSPPSRPLPPTFLKVTEISMDSVTLEWSTSLHSSPPSGYTIKYRALQEPMYQYHEVSDGRRHSARVEGLTTGRQYSFSIQAWNSHGSSHYLLQPVFVTLPSEGERLGISVRAPTQGNNSGIVAEVGGGGRGQGLVGLTPDMVGTSSIATTSSATSSRVPRLLLLIMTLTGAALLVLNISIIACFVRRRANNRAPQVSATSKSVSLESCGVTLASSPEVNSSEGLFSLTANATTRSSATRSSPTVSIYEGELQMRPLESEAEPRVLMTTSSGSSSILNGGVITTNSTFIVITKTSAVSHGTITTTSINNDLSSSNIASTSSPKANASLYSTSTISPYHSNTALHTTMVPQASCTAALSQRSLLPGSSPLRSPSPEVGDVSISGPDMGYFPTEPDICSLSSSVYDNASPPSNRIQSINSPIEEEPTDEDLDDEDPMEEREPDDDQFSLCSNRSNNSRISSHCYDLSLSTSDDPGCLTLEQIPTITTSSPKQQPTTPDVCQHHHQQTPDLCQHEQQMQKPIGSPAKYANLNPTALFNLSFDSRDGSNSVASFSAGTAAGYATLGGRSHHQKRHQTRESPPRFFTLQKKSSRTSDEAHYPTVTFVTSHHQESPESLGYTDVKDVKQFGSHEHILKDTAPSGQSYDLRQRLMSDVGGSGVPSTTFAPPAPPKVTAIDQPGFQRHDFLAQGHGSSTRSPTSSSSSPSPAAGKRS